MTFTREMRDNARVGSGEASTRRAAAARQPKPDLAAAARRLLDNDDRTPTDARTD